MPAGRVGGFGCNEAARYGWTPRARCDLPWALAKVALRPRVIAESQLRLTMSHSAVSERAVVCVVDADASMRRSQILLNFAGAWTAIAGALICCLTCTLLVARPAHALDPSKRVTQYLHTSWRIQDASAPAGMFTVAQTSEGFLWFSTNSPTIYRFDGVRFLPSHFPYKGGSGNKVFKVLGSRAGGLWAVGSREIAYIKEGAVVYDVQLDGFSSFQNLSEDPDGSLWVVRAAANIADSALCRVADGKVKCFGKAEGVPISPIDSILADGKGGFWLGGQTALVHWRDGVSETYPIEALRSNVGQHGVGQPGPWCGRNPVGRHARGRAGPGNRTTKGRRRQTICDAHVRWKQSRGLRDDRRSRGQRLGRQPRQGVVSDPGRRRRPLWT